MNYYTRKLVIGVTGILTATMATSYLVEKIFNEKYMIQGSDKGDLFVYPSLVTWMGCLFCSLYGLLYASVWDKQPNLITFPERFRLGLLFTLNYLPTNYALLYISYPLQVITKNTRYLLVVIVGVYFTRVKKNKQLKLPKSKVLIALIISLGAGLFMYFDSNKSSAENHFHPEKKWIGLLLLLVAIICDAMFSDSQAYCKAAFHPTQNQLFLAANLYGFVLIFLFSLVSGQLAPSIRFLLRHPQIQRDIFLIASLQVASQISVYFVISNFKQHIYPLISTVRKLMTILFSIFIFKHKISFYQWIAIGIVFVAMGFELYDEVQSQEQNRKVRKERLKESYLQEQEEARDVILGEKSQIKENKQIATRSNRFLRQSRKEESGNRNQSNSKYGYGWRKQEVVENRESSLSPFKKE